MGLFGFGKKEEESTLPKLPLSEEDLKLPSIDDIPRMRELEKNENKLPSLPDYNVREKFREDAIKNTINEPFLNMHKSKFAPLKSPNVEHIRAEPIEELDIDSREIVSPSSRINSIKKMEPIYVRLDKFQTTMEAFEEIKGKIQDIEELLRKTKEIRAKEEQELEKWEREVQLIKTRISAIDKNIFSELD